MIADVLHLWNDRVVVGNSLLAFRGYAVCLLACRHQLFHHHLYDLCALGYLADDVDVAGTHLLDFLFREDVAHRLHGLGQSALVVRSHRDDMVHRQVAQHACLNLYLLRISLPLYLVAGSQLLAVHDVETLEHADTVVVEIAVEDERTGCLHIQASTLGLCHPLVAVAIAIEMDGTTSFDVLAQYLHDGPLREEGGGGCRVF